MSSTATQICANVPYSSSRFVGTKESTGTDCSSSSLAGIYLEALIDCNTFIPSNAPSGTQAWKQDCTVNPVTGNVQQGSSYYSDTHCSDSDLIQFVVDPNWNPPNNAGEQCYAGYTYSNRSPVQYLYQTLSCINDGNVYWAMTSGTEYLQQQWNTGNDCNSQVIEWQSSITNQCGPFYSPTQAYKSAQYIVNSTGYSHEYAYTSEDCTGTAIDLSTYKNGECKPSILGQHCTDATSSRAAYYQNINSLKVAITTVGNGGNGGNGGSTTSSSIGNLKHSDKLGIGLGVGLGLAFLAAVYFIWKRNRMRWHTKDTQNDKVAGEDRTGLSGVASRDTIPAATGTAQGNRTSQLAKGDGDTVMNPVVAAMTDL